MKIFWHEGISQNLKPIKNKERDVHNRMGYPCYHTKLFKSLSTKVNIYWPHENTRITRALKTKASWGVRCICRSHGLFCILQKHQARALYYLIRVGLFTFSLLLFLIQMFMFFSQGVVQGGMNLSTVKRGYDRCDELYYYLFPFF